MKLFNLVLISIFVHLVSSCEKDYSFVHTDEYINNDCACSQYAGQFEGAYTGTYLNRWFAVFGDTAYMDTIFYGDTTIFVNKISVPEDFVTDSMICALYIDGIINDTVYIKDGTGDVHPKPFPNFAFDHYSSKLTFSKNNTYPAYSNNIPYLSVSFVGFK